MKAPVGQIRRTAMALSSNGGLPSAAGMSPLSDGVMCMRRRALDSLASSITPINPRRGFDRSVRAMVLRSTVFPRGSSRRASEGRRLLNWSPSSCGGSSASLRRFMSVNNSGRFIDQPRSPPSAPIAFASVVSPDRRTFASQVYTNSDGHPLVMDDEKLLKAIIYEAQHNFSNVFGKASRFGDFLYSQLLLRSTTAGNTFSTLEKDAKQYEHLDSVNRAQLLDRVAQVMGFLNTQDLIAHHVAFREASEDLQDSHSHFSERSASTTELEFKNDVKADGLQEVHGGHSQPEGALLKPIASSIKFGSSQPIELYKSPKEGRVKSTPLASESRLSAKNTKSPDTSEGQAKAVQEKASRPVKKKFTAIPVAETLMPAINTQVSTSHVIPPVRANDKFDSGSSYVEESTELMLMRGAAKYKDCVLDIPVSFIKNLSVYQRTRLEENGFHTLRMLLQHFPRTYVNFQQAGQRIEDGQHLSFVGMIMSSRGLCLGPSLSAVEVIVKSKVDAQDTSVEEFSDKTFSQEAISDKEHSDEVAYGSSPQGKTVFLHLKKFFRGARFTSPWFLNKMSAKYPIYAQVAVGGKVKALPLEGHFEIREYNLELWDQDPDDLRSSDGGDEVKPELEMTGKPYPVYPSKGGLQPKTLEFCIQRMLPALPLDLDPMPKKIRDKYEFMELRQAYFGMHTPHDAKDAEQARRRLVFDEFFYLQLGMLLQRQQLEDKCSRNVGLPKVAECGTLEMEKWSPLTLKLVKSLPYSLTNSQKKASSEIIWDLQSPIPMSRLLQGDVGCGKTIVAFLGLLEVIDAGYQGALMAPTEFLAIQHYQRIMGWLEVLEDHERPQVALLTGSTPIAKARMIRSGLESGDIVLAVGTHSLISDSVRFASLGLAVVDEQHRFGVAQRGRLNSKVRDSDFTLSEENLATVEEGEIGDTSTVLLSAPHVLAMSATPIPRTLALAMHGDMSISQITELPPGRPKTVTLAFYGNRQGRQDAYELMREELESGGRVFVVYPVIEVSEELPELRAAETEFEILTELFDEFQCGLVHGRMKIHEKEAAMELFKAGKSQILVSTTVIEVGIDIPEASMIVIENAERYGMAQLHQLRGRVGRGTRESKCLLLGSTEASLNRLQLLENSNDGFYLAEIDLRLRGPGEMLGKRQSGYLPEFGIARLDQDGEIMENARAAAEEVLRAHHGLDDLPRLKQELSMRRPPFPLG